ncbi:MAG TPA: hypothetical protein EYG18_08775 [Micavibrio sp.]|nr:hypothetical protein [Micavibrio sp.]HIL29349.1 hypothetical protein [Micavibrio sp.]
MTYAQIPSKELEALLNHNYARDGMISPLIKDFKQAVTKMSETDIAPLKEFLTTSFRDTAKQAREQMAAPGSKVSNQVRRSLVKHAMAKRVIDDRLEALTI